MQGSIHFYNNHIISANYSNVDDISYIYILSYELFPRTHLTEELLDKFFNLAR